MSYEPGDLTFREVLNDAAYEVNEAINISFNDPGKQRRIRMMHIRNAIDILNVAMGSL